MKLAIQIPAYNEQDSVLEVLKSIPKQIKGIDEIYVFVVDDGSDDNTSQIAFDFGVDVVKIPFKQGLANAFRVGVSHALKNKADILVNIDGDNQYCASEIVKLIQPILNDSADAEVLSHEALVEFSENVILYDNGSRIN